MLSTEEEYLSIIADSLKPLKDISKNLEELVYILKTNKSSPKTYWEKCESIDGDD